MSTHVSRSLRRSSVSRPPQRTSSAVVKRASSRAGWTSGRLDLRRPGDPRRLERLPDRQVGRHDRRLERAGQAEADAPVNGEPRDVLPVQLDAPAVGPVVSREDVEERRLACPVRPCHAEDVPALDRERDTVHGDEAAVQGPDVGAGERHDASFGFLPDQPPRSSATAAARTPSGCTAPASMIWCESAPSSPGWIWKNRCGFPSDGSWISAG